ncbi:MAG: lipopolysaccharide biosynthesis protein [Cetobacterium sp.]
MNKNRLKLFLENFLFYGGLRIITQIVPFIMLPIVSRYLSETMYGIADIYNVLIFFGTQLVGLGIWDAMYREYFEKEELDYKMRVTSTALIITLISGIFFGLILLFFKNKLSVYIFSGKEYSFLIILAFFSININSLKAILEAPIRMENRRKQSLIFGIITPILNYILILVLLKLEYTYESLIYSNLILNTFLLLIFLVLNFRYFNLKKYDKKIGRELLKMGIAILPMALVYWIFNSFDRMMISKMLNMKEVGVYSVGTKVASISQIVSSAFAGGWTYFSYLTMKDKDQKKMNSLIFEYLGIISIFLFLLSLPFIDLVFNNFFIGEYRRGAEVFPFLFLCPLFLMMNQTLSTQMLIIKKAYLSTISLTLGALLNVVLNFYFIKKFGIKGAALSTLIGYFFSILMNLIINIKYKLNYLNSKFVYILFLLWGVILLIFINNLLYKYLAMYLFVNIIIIYGKEILNIRNKF